MYRPPAWTIAASVLLFGRLLTDQAGRTASEQLTFRADVNLVQVDVGIFAADGQPIRGLTAADFKIFDRNRPRPVETFAEITNTPATELGVRAFPNLVADVADNTHARVERVIVLVIDDLNIWKDRTSLAQAMAKRLIDGLIPHASIAVLFSSGRGSVELTTDHGRLVSAIEKMKGQFHAMRATGQCTPGTPESCYGFKTIQDAARMLGDDPRHRKAVILLSESYGVDIRGLFDTMVAEQPEDRAAEPWHANALLDMMNALRRANVTLYTIDPRGRLQTPEERSRESRGTNPILRMSDPQYWSQEGLQLMADAAGGFAVVDTNDFDRGLDRIVADLDHYYLLGFRPDPRDDRWHNIRVVVDIPGVTVRYRKGYRLSSSPAVPKNSDPLIELSAGVLPRTDLPLRLFATPMRATTRSTTVRAVIEARGPREKLKRADGTLGDSVSLTVLAADLKQHKVTERVSRNEEVVVAGSGAPERDEVSYQVETEMTLRPGLYQLRASLASRAFASAGSVYLMIDVPAAPKAGVSIGPVIIGTNAGAARTRPSLNRVFQQTDVLKVVYGLLVPSPVLVITAVEVIDADGRPIVTERRDVGGGARNLTEVSLPLASLRPGQYRLRISVVGGSPAREIDFAVAAEPRTTRPSGS